MKKQMITMPIGLLILIFLCTNCGGPDFTPPPNCEWKNNGAIAFNNLELPFPPNASSIASFNTLFSYITTKKLTSFWDAMLISSTRISINLTANSCSSSTNSETVTYDDLGDGINPTELRKVPFPVGKKVNAVIKIVSGKVYNEKLSCYGNIQWHANIDHAETIFQDEDFTVQFIAVKSSTAYRNRRIYVRNRYSRSSTRR